MIRVIQSDDFTGGLNLEANVFQLAPNQSPDMLNVDINQRGGVQRRFGVERRNMSNIGTGSITPQRLYAWDGAQVNQLLLSTSDKVFYSTSDNFTDMGISSDAVLGAKFASWTKDSTSELYIAIGHSHGQVKWDGTTVTTLTASGPGAWQNDLTNPNGTHMPRANYVVTHQDRLWVADTSENGVRYPNRVRFSHPLFPESWREDDYIDVIGGGHSITGIVSFAGHLVVFKQRAVFAIYGYSDDTFQVVELTRSVGAANSKCIAVTDAGIYFFSYPEGVYFYDGKGIRDVFKNIRPIIYDGAINEQALEFVSMGYANKKLFVSLPVGSQDLPFGIPFDDSSYDYNDFSLKYDGGIRVTKPNVSFVFNETVGREGAWTIYATGDGYAFVSPTTYTDNDGITNYVAAHPNLPLVFNFDIPEKYTDSLSTTFAYQSYYVTPWMDGGNYVANKFWRRPDFVMRREMQEVDMGIQIYRDWNAADIRKNYTLTSPGLDLIMVNSGSSNLPDLGSQIVKGHSLGYGRSIQLKISNSQGLPWCLNSIAYKYNPRGVDV